MRILAVHSSSPYLGVAITDAGVLVAETVFPPAREHVERLAVVVDDQISRLGIRLKDVDGFGVATGPGSFSGIRVGLATVKGMALALQKPVAGISSLDVLAWQGLHEGEAGAAIIDARRHEAYIALYKKSGSRLICVGAPRLVHAKKLLPYIEQLGIPTVLCGDEFAAPVMETVPKAARREVVVPSAGTCALLASRRLEQGDADELHSLSPLYIRPSDAEEKRASPTTLQRQSGEPSF